MKDFEQKLERQPMREIPAGWRTEILAAAERNRRAVSAAPVSEEQAALVAGWRLLLARLPLAWSALAAVWLVLIGANLMLQSPVVSIAAQSPSSTRLANLAALELLTSEFDVAGDPPVPIPEAAPSHKPSVLPQRPRSELWRGLGFGEANPDFPVDDIA